MLNEPKNNCESCSGTGHKLYPNTGTWHRGVRIVGQAMTYGACNVCWGSGDRDKPWPSHQEYYDMKKEIDGLYAIIGRFLSDYKQFLIDTTELKKDS